MPFLIQDFRMFYSGIELLPEITNLIIRVTNILILMTFVDSIIIK